MGGIVKRRPHKVRVEHKPNFGNALTLTGFLQGIKIDATFRVWGDLHLHFFTRPIVKTECPLIRPSKNCDVPSSYTTRTLRGCRCSRKTYHTICSVNLQLEDGTGPYDPYKTPSQHATGTSNICKVPFLKFVFLAKSFSPCTSLLSFTLWKCADLTSAQVSFQEWDNLTVAEFSL